MEHAPQQLSAKIIILGGGIAGISAANRLSKAGETDFLILEARPRLGGRIHTKKYGRHLPFLYLQDVSQNCEISDRLLTTCWE